MVTELHFKLKVDLAHSPEDVEQAIEEEAMDIFGTALEPMVVELQDELWIIMLDFEGTEFESDDDYALEVAEEFMEALAYHLDSKWVMVDADNDHLSDEFHIPQDA